MPKSRPPHPAEFRQQIVELWRAGVSAMELAREFGCSARNVTKSKGQTANEDGKPLPIKKA